MNDIHNALGFLRELAWEDLALVVAVIVVSRLVVIAAREAVKRVAEKAPAGRRLAILGWSPKIRLLIDVATILIVLSIVADLTLNNTFALIASLGLVFAFAFKDYGSCLIAGLVTIVENTYQPGDWVEIDGIYGEVRSIGMRAVHLVTSDENEVVIPHSRLWSTSVSNATSGKRSLLCTAHFYLAPDHDAAQVRQHLIDIAEGSALRLPDSDVGATVVERPWGTHYRLKAHVKDSRDQFRFITDLTLRGKEALRAMDIRFAQAPYAETAKR
jgi:small conductance mechanosensitive channel